MAKGFGQLPLFICLTLVFFLLATNLIATKNGEQGGDLFGVDQNYRFINGIILLNLVPF